MLTLPQTAIYALRAVHRIAAEPDGVPVSTTAIAASLKLPRNYLSKTLHQLVRAGVLQSSRGPGGGFRLVAPPTAITLADVVRPFLSHDGKACILGRGSCNDRAPCAAHQSWKPAKSEMLAFFSGTTIDALIESDRRA